MPWQSVIGTQVALIMGTKTVEYTAKDKYIAEYQQIWWADAEFGKNGLNVNLCPRQQLIATYLEAENDRSNYRFGNVIFLVSDSYVDTHMLDDPDTSIIAPPFVNIILGEESPFVLLVGMKRL